MADSWVTVTSSHRPDTKDTRNPNSKTLASADHSNENSRPTTPNRLQGKSTQVKFVFGDDDSDSSRSYVPSLTSPNPIGAGTKDSGIECGTRRNISPKGTQDIKIQIAAPSLPKGISSTSEKSGNKDTDSHKDLGGIPSGVELSKGGLNLPASSPSTRISVAKAQGSPISTSNHLAGNLGTESSSSDYLIPPTKLPLTAKFLLNNRSTSIHAQNAVQSSPNNNHSNSSLTPLPSSSNPLTSGSPTLPYNKSIHPNNNHHPRSISSPNISRTQQKLELQRQHSITDDLSSLLHPQNQLKLSKEVDKVNRQFGFIKKHHNPVFESLQRVMERKRLEMLGDGK